MDNILYLIIDMNYSVGMMVKLHYMGMIYHMNDMDDIPYLVTTMNESVSGSINTMKP